LVLVLVLALVPVMATASEWALASVLGSVLVLGRVTAFGSVSVPEVGTSLRAAVALPSGSQMAWTLLLAWGPDRRPVASRSV
jgi:hypothetical protein